MILKDDIETLKKHIDEVQEKINILERIKSDCCSQLLQNALSCSEILNEAKWILTDDNRLSSSIHRHKLLSGFLQTTYHCNFDVGNIHLYFDDDDINLMFCRADALTNFLKTYNILIDTTSVENHIRSTKQIIERDQKELEQLQISLEKMKAINLTNALPETTSKT
ncbi:MAG: hypothetical protein PHF86_09850 [Candidatus Nanoarchaeia archaeon]|nr:hypothetical protein [Candidatus Nanoarchaeia archaeon]